MKYRRFTLAGVGAGVLLALPCLGSAQTVGVHAAPPGPEYARVISSTAVQTAVTVPKEICGTEQVTTPARTSGAGAAMGAIAGGAMGNAVGKGSGRALATALGVVGGAMLGDRIEGPAVAQTNSVPRCITQHTTEYRTTGYNVVYEYAGKQYSVQMPQDPGSWLKVQVSPAVQSAPAVSHPPLGMISSAPVAPVVIRSSVAYPVQPVPVVVVPAFGVGVTQPDLGVKLRYGAPGQSSRWY
jgi:uncharacterized protein YcfJ